MARRDNATPLDRAEISVIDIEERTANAEAEFNIICNDKKRILGEIELLNKTIFDGKTILEKIKSETDFTEKNLRMVRDSYIKENESLHKIIIDRKAIEKDFEEFKKLSELKFNRISAGISASIDDHNVKKTVFLNELKELENKKQSIIELSKASADSLESLKKQEVNYIKTVKTAENDCEVLLNKKSYK